MNGFMIHHNVILTRKSDDIILIVKDVLQSGLKFGLHLGNEVDSGFNSDTIIYSVYPL